MMNLIRVGDDADRGDKVDTGSLTMKFDGRYVARKGDRVALLWPFVNVVVDWLTMWRQVDQANKRIDLGM